MLPPDMQAEKLFFVCKFDTISSTQTEMKALMRRNVRVPEWSVVAADYQTRGHGTRGRRWQSERGKNALFSFVWYPPFGGDEADRLKLLAPVAVASVLRGEGMNAAVKFPNDILIGGRKAAGILVESAVRHGRIRYAVTGIGLNVNQEEFPGLEATSVLKETGRHTLPDTWIFRIVEAYRRWSRAAAETVMDAFARLWDTPGPKKGLLFDKRCLPGKMIRIRGERLLFRHDDGSEETFPMREVKPWV
ncbi:MAG: biotin--[acetyl-CoA-carboxylase] ligase [Chlorobi bacterium]|nr:biotin--[acetyl-CoA-carboxylase] ligase [Chlorobiota bacterium]